MRDRLKDLFKNINYKPFEQCTMETSVANQFTEYALNHIIDELIANGVIVPPVKVGDKVYVDSDTWGYDYIYFDSKFINSKYFLIGEIVSIIKTKKQLLMKIRVSNSMHSRYKHKKYTVNAIGTTVFLTREQAEQAKERGE